MHIGSIMAYTLLLTSIVDFNWSMIMYIFFLDLISLAEEAISHAYLLFWFYKVHLRP